jgi:hypothetical protein
MLDQRLSQTASPVAAGQDTVPFSAEPSEHAFGDSVCANVSDSLYRVLSYTDPEESVFTWLAPAEFDEWHESPEAVTSAVAENVAALRRQRRCLSLFRRGTPHRPRRFAVRLRPRGSAFPSNARIPLACHISSCESGRWLTVMGHARPAAGRAIESSSTELAAASGVVMALRAARVR